MTLVPRPTSAEELAIDGGIYEASRWQRIDLRTYIGLPPELPDIGGFFYPGRRHLISGPGEAMKTWLCLIAAVAEVKESRGVIWADLDGMGPREIASRLVALGVNEDAIAEFIYFPDAQGGLGSAELRGLTAWATGSGCRLFVADAFTGFLVRHGLDGDRGPDVERAWQLLDPFLEQGIAVALIDHVVKNPDNRRGQAIGSERKGTAAHLHFDLRPLETLSRGGMGRSRIGVSRDRGAYFPRPSAGNLVLCSDPDSGSITWALEPPRADGDSFRPTGYMEKVSRYVEANPEAKTGEVERNVDGKTDYIRNALDVLVQEGYVDRTHGARGALLHTSLRPYREGADDLAPTSPLTGASSVSGAPKRPRPSPPSIGGKVEVDLHLAPNPGGELDKTTTSNHSSKAGRSSNERPALALTDQADGWLKREVGE